MSFWNRPLFPEWCSDATLDDSATYDTMVRIAGSWNGIAHTFKAVADMYGWTHIVLVSDHDTAQACWYGSRFFEGVFGNDENYTFTWLRFGSDPSDEDIDMIIDQIRALTRGFSSHYLLFIISSHFFVFCRQRSIAQHIHVITCRFSVVVH